MKRFLKLLAIAVPVAWFQLPVMQERALSLSPISDALAQTTHDGLASVTAAAGKPVVALRDTAENGKDLLEARILAGPIPVSQVAAVAVASAPAAASIAAAPATPVGPTAKAAMEKAAATRSASVTAPASVAQAASAAQLPTTVATVAIFHQKKTVVLEGDSVMGEIAFSFQRFAAHKTSWTVINAHKVSSGLCNTEYYDWPKTAADLAKQYHPDIVLLTMGPNDGQDIYEPGKRMKFGSDTWHVEYVARFKKMVEDASSTGAKVYWFAVPVMRDATLEKKMTAIRAAQQDALAQLPQVTVIDETASFHDDQGHFIEKGKINGKLRTLRAGDGVHLTATGADILVNALENQLTMTSPIAAR